LAAGVNAAVLVEAEVKDVNGMQVLKMPVPAAWESSVPWKEVEDGLAPSANEKQVEEAVPATAMAIHTAPVAEKPPHTLRRMVACQEPHVTAVPLAPTPITPTPISPTPITPTPIPTKAKQANPTKLTPLPPKSPAPSEGPSLCIGILPRQEDARVVEDECPLIQAWERQRCQEDLEVECKIEYQASKQQGKVAEVRDDGSRDGDEDDEDEEQYSESSAEEGKPKKKRSRLRCQLKNLKKNVTRT